jgi:hypothetical protein
MSEAYKSGGGVRQQGCLPGSAGALAGKVSQGATEWNFPQVSLNRQAWTGTSHDGV